MCIAACESVCASAPKCISYIESTFYYINTCFYTCLKEKFIDGTSKFQMKQLFDYLRKRIVEEPDKLSK